MKVYKNRFLSELNFLLVSTIKTLLFLQNRKSRMGKKDFFVRRKVSRNIYREKFNEPQWQILKFLTQFYTFKKFQRRLLSSYTIFLPDTYIWKYLCLMFMPFYVASFLISFSLSRNSRNHQASYSERKHLPVKFNCVQVCDCMGKFSEFCFWRLRTFFLLFILFYCSKKKT